MKVALTKSKPYSIYKIRYTYIFLSKRNLSLEYQWNQSIKVFKITGSDAEMVNVVCKILDLNIWVDKNPSRKHCFYLRWSYLQNISRVRRDRFRKYNRNRTTVGFFLSSATNFSLILLISQSKFYKIKPNNICVCASVLYKAVIH